MVMVHCFLFVLFRAKARARKASPRTGRQGGLRHHLFIIVHNLTIRLSRLPRPGLAATWTGESNHSSWIGDRYTIV